MKIILRLHNRNSNERTITDIFLPERQKSNGNCFITKLSILTKLSVEDISVVDELLRRCNFNEEEIPFDEFIIFLEKGTVPQTALVNYRNLCEQKDERYENNHAYYNLVSSIYFCLNVYIYHIMYFCSYSFLICYLKKWCDVLFPFV